jgi:hypothetical protein
MFQIWIWKYHKWENFNVASALCMLCNKCTVFIYQKRFRKAWNLSIVMHMARWFQEPQYKNQKKNVRDSDSMHA